MIRGSLRLARKVMAMVCLLTGRTISKNERFSRPLVYQPNLAFDFRRRIRVGNRGWYGDMPEGPISLPRWREPSFTDEIVEQTRLEWLQRRLLIPEELRLALAHLAAFLRVAIKGVVGNLLASGFQ